MTGKSTFLYRRVYDDLREKIEKNVIRPGDRLKSEQELREEYGVSRDTLRKALSKLEQEDYIFRRPHLGTFVKRPKSNYSLFKMKSFSEQMREKGIVPSSELLSITLTGKVPPEVAECLELGGGERCYIITRIRKGDGEPMAYEETYIPQELCPDLQKYLDDNASLYDIYENVYMLKLNYGKLTLEAETPEPMVRDLLNMPKGIPVLKMICIFYLDDGRPLYYVRSDYIGNKYLFSTQIPR